MPYSPLFFLLAIFLVPGTGLAQGITPGPTPANSRVELRGEVIAFDFASPVTRIVFDVPSSDGSSSPWTAETGPAVELRRHGWTSTSLSPGELILVRGEILDAASGRIALQEIERVNGTRLVPGDSRELSRLSAGTYHLVPGRGQVRLSFDHQGFSLASFWFTRLQANLNLDAQGNPSGLQVDLLTEDLESSSAELTRLLESGTFFAASSYPVISYTSRAIEHLGENRYRILGDLSIKGISQPVELIAVVNKAGTHPLTGNPGFGVSARGELDRSQWDMAQFGPEVGLEVAIEVQTEFELGAALLSPSGLR